MSDRMMRRVLKVCAGVLFLCGAPMVVMAVVQRDARMGLYGVLSLLFALSNVLQLLIADERSATDPSEYAKNRIIYLLSVELDRLTASPSHPSTSASPATAHDSRGESLRKEQNGELEWVDDETRGPMLKPAEPKRSHTSPPSDA